MVLGTTTTRLDVEKAAFDPLLAAADKAEPKIRRAMLAALEGLVAEIPDLEALISAGSTGPVFTAIQDLDVPPKLRAALADATLTAAVQGGAPEAAKFAISMNDVNERALRWATTNAGQLITRISPKTLSVIRDLVTVGVQNGVHPSITARQIRGVVPLTVRQAKQVARLYSSSIEAGVSPSHASKVAHRKARQLQRYRSVMIARTEAIRSANMGQQLVWETAADRSLIENPVKVWMATEDSRTCQVCEALDGTPVGLGDSFLVPSRSTRRPSAKPEKTPPAHPLCRCTIVLEAIPVPSR